MQILYIKTLQTDSKDTIFFFYLPHNYFYKKTWTFNASQEKSHDDFCQILLESMAKLNVLELEDRY